MAVSPRTTFHSVKRRVVRAGPAERAGWVVGLAIAAPVLVPMFLFYRARKRSRSQALLKTLLPARRPSFAQPGTVERPEVDAEAEARLQALPATYALARIIGNDLPPRHSSGQSHDNLRFVLEHEPDFPNCEKLWVLNRIRDPREEARIVAALEAAGQDYLRLPFELEAYSRAPLDLARFPVPQYLVSPEFLALDEAERVRAVTQCYRLKNNYAMNNNGARNAALELGRSRAKWVLPWDGNCFLTAADWELLVAGIAAQAEARYFVVPMARLGSNDDAFDAIAPADAEEEPQIVFRQDARERFDEAHPYGRRPKVELLARLGVAGPWMRWPLDPWDLAAGELAPESHFVGRAGMVRRLTSGRSDLEQKDRQALHGRGSARNEAIVTTLRSLDGRVLAERGFDARRPALYGAAAIGALARDRGSRVARDLQAAVARALGRGPFSVVDKTELPPSGNPADYFHPAPYWWPDPRSRDGLPYVWRDGERLPGTVMYAPESDRYDRTRLQYMIEDTVVCGLAWAAFGDARCREHARRQVGAWFLDPATAMTPHLRYAQVRRGHAKDEGAKTGIIEFKDIAYLLDAVRLLDDPDLSGRLSGWLSAYRDWLVASPQGVGERQSLNNHGVFYDLHLASVAAFLDDRATLLDCYLASTARLAGHFVDEGAQPHELARTLTKHYCAFNLQGWLSLLAFYRACGFPIEHQPDFARVAAGSRWLLAWRGREWPYEQASEFDEDRLAAIALCSASLGHGTEITAEDLRLAVDKPQFHPHDGIPPYWPLTLDPALTSSAAGIDERRGTELLAT